jgi:hypothetical protein
MLLLQITIHTILRKTASGPTMIPAFRIASFDGVREADLVAASGMFPGFRGDAILVRGIAAAGVSWSQLTDRSGAATVEAGYRIEGRDWSVQRNSTGEVEGLRALTAEPAAVPFGGHATCKFLFNFSPLQLQNVINFTRLLRLSECCQYDCVSR